VENCSGELTAFISTQGDGRFKFIEKWRQHVLVAVKVKG
jgi:hypothetical protein